MNRRQYFWYHEVCGKSKEFYLMELNTGAILIESPGPKSFEEDVVNLIIRRNNSSLYPTIDPNKIHNGFLEKDMDLPKGSHGGLDRILIDRIKRKVFRGLYKT